MYIAGEQLTGFVATCVWHASVPGHHLASITFSIDKATNKKLSGSLGIKGTVPYSLKME